MVKLSLFLFSIDILITQQKRGCWLYFHLRNTIRMFRAIVVFRAQGFSHGLATSSPVAVGRYYHTLGNLVHPGWKVRKPLQLPESIHLSQQFVSLEYEMGQQLNLRLWQSCPWNKSAGDFHHIQTKPQEVLRPGQRYLDRNTVWSSGYLVYTAVDFSWF